MIAYKKRKSYKYRLYEDYRVHVGIRAFRMEGTKYLILTTDGDLIIKKDYVWDGATCAIDTKNFMRGALIHDALYQLIREGIISTNKRKDCDEILREICIEDGMSRLRASIVYRAVRMFGGKAIRSDIIRI